MQTDWFLYSEWSSHWITKMKCFWCMITSYPQMLVPHQHTTIDLNCVTWYESVTYHIPCLVGKVWMIHTVWLVALQESCLHSRPFWSMLSWPDSIDRSSPPIRINQLINDQYPIHINFNQHSLNYNMLLCYIIIESII